MPYRKYTAAEKKAYYARKAAAAAAARSKMRGSGRYYYGRPKVTGRGRYNFSAPKVGGAVGKYIGGAIGTAIAPGIGTAAGQAIGGWAGGKLGSMFKSITGFGEYQIKENSLLYPDRVVPSFGEDTIRVKKREYICDINATTAFTNNSFPINPGLDTTFPWLSSIAQCYEQYRFNGIVFQFVSTSSDAIASTTDLGLGQVILATDYNAVDPVFVNSPQMLGSMFSNSGKPSENIMHAIECAPPDQAQKIYYVRTGDNPSGTDLRLYDLGTFQLATQKMPADYDGMGQLWVTYDVTFCKSVQNNQLGFNLNTDVWEIVAPAVSGPAYFGSSDADRVLREHSNLGTTLTSSKITFPPTISSGYYMIYYHAAGSATAVSNPSLALVNASFVKAWADSSLDGISNSGTTSGNYIGTWIIRITDRDATVTFSSGTLPSSPTVGDLVITQVNGEIFLDAPF